MSTANLIHDDYAELMAAASDLGHLPDDAEFQVWQEAQIRGYYLDECPELPDSDFYTPDDVFEPSIEDQQEAAMILNDPYVSIDARIAQMQREGDDYERRFGHLITPAAEGDRPNRDRDRAEFLDVSRAVFGRRATKLPADPERCRVFCEAMRNAWEEGQKPATSQPILSYEASVRAVASGNALWIIHDPEQAGLSGQDAASIHDRVESEARTAKGGAL